MIIDFNPKDRTKLIKVAEGRLANPIAAMNAAKLYGNKEIKQLTEAFNRFYDEIKNLAIVDAVDFGESMKFMVDDAITNLYEPLINAGNAEGLSDESYNTLRVQIFAAIMEKYKIDLSKVDV